MKSSIILSTNQSRVKNRSNLMLHVRVQMFFFLEPKDRCPICLIKHCVCRFDLRMITANFIKQLHVISEFFLSTKAMCMNK